MQANGAGAEASDQTAEASATARSRWPNPDPRARYVVMLGGSATLGKSVAEPFPAQVAAATGLQVLNLGTANGGPDAYLSDSVALHLMSRAEVAVVQLTGAEALTNPFYCVHSRRNDRFVAATPELRALYPEVDFTEIHFARHLLQVLARVDAGRFAVVVEALKATWVARMQSLLVHLPLRRRLLWLSDAPPPDRADGNRPGPLFVDWEMLERLRPLAGEVIVVPALEARPGDDLEERFAFPDGLPGPAAHREAARILAPLIAAQIRRPPLQLQQALMVP